MTKYIRTYDEWFRYEQELIAEALIKKFEGKQYYPLERKPQYLAQVRARVPFFSPRQNYKDADRYDPLARMNKWLVDMLIKDMDKMYKQHQGLIPEDEDFDPITLTDCINLASELGECGPIPKDMQDFINSCK